MNTTWAYASNNFIYSAMALYTLSFLAHAFETAWAVRAPQSEIADETVTKKKTLDYSRTEKAARLATAFLALATLLLLAGIICRGIANGHAPWGNMYEFSITGSFAFSAAYLVALRKYLSLIHI
jgi:hypothetical protein